MGLDAVELVMAVEEAFAVAIEDAEAEKILTPRLLIELIQQKVSTSSTAVCLTHRAFVATR